MCALSNIGAWLSLVERQFWELDVARSNRVAPTIFKRPLKVSLTVTAERLGRSTEWRRVQRTYRQLLYGAGEANPEGGSRRGFTREKVQQVWAEDGELRLADLLRCRVRYFSDSLAFGSRAYAEEIFEQQRGYFSEARASGARKFHGLSELFGLRDLRVDVVS